MDDSKIGFCKEESESVGVCACVRVRACVRVCAWVRVRMSVREIERMGEIKSKSHVAQVGMKNCAVIFDRMVLNLTL